MQHYTSYSMNYEFYTYVMYQPPQGDWVPLSFLHWGFSLVTTYSSNNPAVTSSKFQAYMPNFASTTVEPSWTYHWDGAAANFDS